MPGARRRDDWRITGSIRRRRRSCRTRVRREMVEELTGEMVAWDEDLSVLNDYQRDLMPWEVEPRTRARWPSCAWC